jgi:hypothetical protein
MIAYIENLSIVNKNLYRRLQGMEGESIQILMKIIGGGAGN